MFQVNDRLADMQFGKVANECVRVNGATGILTTARDALAEQVALANQRQAALVVDKPVLGGANHQIAAVAGGFLQTQHVFWRNFNPRQHFAQRFTATLAFHREDNRAGKRFEEAAQIIQRRFVLCLDGDVRQRLVAQIGICRFVRQALGFQLYARPLFQFAKQLIAAQPQQFRRQERAHRIDAAVFKTGAGFILETLRAGLEIAGVDDQRAGREIAE